MKVIIPIAPVFGLDLFAKGGVAYRMGRIFLDNRTVTEGGGVQPSVTTSTLKSSFSSWRPMMALGAQYHITQNWVINAQFMFIPDGVAKLARGLGTIQNSSSGGGSAAIVVQAGNGIEISVPSTYLVTGGIGYIFAT